MDHQRRGLLSDRIRSARALRRQGMETLRPGHRPLISSRRALGLRQPELLGEPDALHFARSAFRDLVEDDDLARALEVRQPRLSERTQIFLRNLRTLAQ